MKTSLFLATFLAAGSALAAPCTNVENANAENFFSCPGNVQSSIFWNQGQVMSGDQLGSRIVVIRSGLGMERQLRYISAKEGKLCSTYLNVEDEYNSSFSRGLTAHLTAKNCKEIGGDEVYNVRTWKGLELYNNVRWDHTDSKAFRMSLVSDVLAYPADPVVAERDAWDTTKSAHERADAFVIAIEKRTPREAALAIMDFIRDPAMSTSSNVGPLAKKLVSLSSNGDERVSVTFQALANDARINDDRLSDVVKVSSGFISPAYSQTLADRVLKSGNCYGELNKQIFNVFPKITPAFEYATASMLSNCGEGRGFDNVSPATKAAIRLGMKSVVLPLLDYLANQVSPLEKYTNQPAGISKEYRTSIVDAINALKYFRPVRALPRLKSSTYSNSKDAAIATAARAAVTAIQGALQVSEIKLAKASAIQWGMDMIRFHNGSAKAVQMEIIAAFKVAIRKNPKIAGKIKAFLRNEIAEGYHAYDVELVAAMKSVSG